MAVGISLEEAESVFRQPGSVRSAWSLDGRDRLDVIGTTPGGKCLWLDVAPHHEDRILEVVDVSLLTEAEWAEVWRRVPSAG